MTEKHDAEIEELLRRYQPGAPPTDLWNQIAGLPQSQVSRSLRTWPWAVAAAALLTIAIGLHGAVVPAPDASPAVDSQRAKAIEQELGPTAGSEAMAEWMARREARVRQDARAARATAVEIGLQ